MFIFVTFPFGILGQVWYLIVSIPDPCCLSYLKINISKHFNSLDVGLIMIKWLFKILQYFNAIDRLNLI